MSVHFNTGITPITQLSSTNLNPQNSTVDPNQNQTSETAPITHTPVKQESCHPNAILTLLTPVDRLSSHLDVRHITAEKVQSLIDQGANVNACYLSGRTPLRALFTLAYDHAIDAKTFVEIAQVLIAKGADVNAKLNIETDDRSILKTAFDCADFIMMHMKATGNDERAKGYFEFLKLLLNHPQIELSECCYLIRTIKRGSENPQCIDNWEEIADILLKKHAHVVKYEKGDGNYNPAQILRGCIRYYKPEFEKPGAFRSIRNKPDNFWN